MSPNTSNPSKFPYDKSDVVQEGTQADKGGDLLPTRHFLSLHRQANTYWWPRTRLAIALALLVPYRFENPALLDLGCGTGEFLKALKQHFFASRAVGVDASPTALQYLQKYHLEHVAADLESQVLIRENGFQLVVSMDVLEHLRNPRALVETAWRNLAPGGFFLANVPAHPSLFSAHDKMLHHVCRFSRRTLKELILSQPFAIRRLSYSFFMPFFPAWIVRKLHLGGSAAQEEYPSIPGWINRLLLWEGRMEAAWLRKYEFPTGLSLTVLAQKTKNS